MSFISNGSGRFTYFDLQLDKPVWRGKTVLDFGGNAGTVLNDTDCTIDPPKYWCMDVSRDAIELGRRRFPQAHWLFYNRYNFAFNPSGVQGLELPATEEKFDYILAYSVFTHTSKAEMLEIVGQLATRLGPGGVLAFTFIDPRLNPARSGGKLQDGFYDGTYFERCLERLMVQHPERACRLLREAAQASWCTLVNDADLYVETDDIGYYEENEKEFYMTFYTDSYMSGLFPGSTILPPARAAYPPLTDSVLQHCCLIKEDGAVTGSRVQLV